MDTVPLPRWVEVRKVKQTNLEVLEFYQGLGLPCSVFFQGFQQISHFPYISLILTLS